MAESTFETTGTVAVDISPVNEAAEKIRGELAKVIVGQREVIDQILIALLCEGHVLLEGVPGIAKTLIVRALALAVSSDFSRIQFTPDLMPSDFGMLRTAPKRLPRVWQSTPAATARTAMANHTWRLT